MSWLHTVQCEHDTLLTVVLLQSTNSHIRLVVFLGQCYSVPYSDLENGARAQADCMEAASRQAASTIDPKLLARVAKGDPQAFEQLYDQSSTLLFTLSYRILNDRDEAAELLQEVYLEVWRKIAKYDVGRGSPIAWLVTLTRSRAIDRLRSRASRGQQAVADSFEHPLVSVTPDVSPNPYEAREDTELRQLMAEAILDLPLPQQQAIEMAFYQGLTHTDIAAKLNQPLGTVKTRIKLAMTKLRASLQQTLPQGEGV